LTGAPPAKLVDMLCRAFDRDAHINWLVRQDAGRTRAMGELFRLLLSEDMAGELFADADLNSAALWFPPDRWPMGWAREAAFFLSYLKIAGPPASLTRGLGLKRMAARHPARPHYYLQLLGVDPAHQGGGLGGALLGAMLGRCDEARVPAYLETSSGKNVAFYGRHGFNPVAETVLTDGPRLWSLVREPGAGAHDISRATA
jgi:GNAT superfamily N-acetyltransferase